MRSPQSEATSAPKAPATTAGEGPASRARRPAHPRDGLPHLQRRYGNRLTRGIIQAKLNVGPVDDPLEREADRISRVAIGTSVQRAPETVQHAHGAEEGVANPSVEQAVTRARGGGQAVPQRVRDRMEQATGADFSPVRLHVDAEADRLNDALGSRAFTVGADVFVRRSEYRPGTARGDALLGHELAHTAQQGATGRGHVNVPAATVQRYVEVAPTDGNYPKKGFDDFESVDDGFFPFQVEDHGSWFANGQDFDPAKSNVDVLEINLKWLHAPVVRFSDDYELAVPVEAQAESKTFFATDTRIRESNTILEKLDGQVRLTRTARHLSVSLQGGQAKRLYQVEPRAVQLPGHIPVPNVQPPGGLSLRTPQDCEQMSRYVLGFQDHNFHNRWCKTLAEVLDEVTYKLRGNAGQRRSAFVKRWAGIRAPGARATKDQWEAYAEAGKRFIADVIGALKGLQAQHGNQFDQRLEDAFRKRKVNQFLRPKIGSQLVVMSRGDWQSGTDLFRYHYGAVVAVSGRDYVTMENYARRDKEVGVSTSGAGDPLFYFYMHGTDFTKETWHSRWADSNSFSGYPLSLAEREPFRRK
ncbi:eCIS core domain-containing protein [Streptomyces phaeochromogenes]